MQGGGGRWPPPGPTSHPGLTPPLPASEQLLQVTLPCAFQAPGRPLSQLCPLPKPFPSPHTVTSVRCPVSYLFLRMPFGSFQNTLAFAPGPRWSIAPTLTPPSDGSGPLASPGLSELSAQPPLSSPSSQLGKLRLREVSPLTQPRILHSLHPAPNAALTPCCPVRARTTYGEMSAPPTAVRGPGGHRGRSVPRETTEAPAGPLLPELTHAQRLTSTMKP